MSFSDSVKFGFFDLNRKSSSEKTVIGHFIDFRVSADGTSYTKLKLRVRIFRKMIWVMPPNIGKKGKFGIALFQVQ